ncbi:MFS transporter [Nonomuraea typhae]|uniref:MFS transporter n=1 Tax=Nonomuraea typhae TaxID=2603600 RepID=A0ABW7ZB63_9ACTN
MLDDGGVVRLRSWRGVAVLAVAEVASSLAVVDANVVNVSVPDIALTYNADIGQIQWVINAYLLGLAGLVLAGGLLVDRWGEFRTYLWSVGCFALFSALCGVSPGIGQLIAFRALQGCAAAVAIPCSLAILRRTIVAEDGARAVMIWWAAGGAVGAAGPMLGGWITDSWDWRWIFFVNVPLAVLSLVAAVFFVPRGRSSVPLGRQRRFACGLLACGLTLITWGLIQGNSDGGTALLPVYSVLAGVLILVVLALHQRRTRNRLIARGVFNRRLVVSCAVLFCVYVSLTAIVLFVVLYAQVVLDESAYSSSFVLLPLPLVTLVVSPLFAGKGVAEYRTIVVGAALSALALFALGTASGDMSYEALVLLVLIYSIGNALAAPRVISTAMAGAGSRHAGAVAGITNTVSRAGSLISGAALPGIIGMQGTSYLVASAFVEHFGRAMAVVALVSLLGCALAFWQLRAEVRRADAC